jgi:signal transduction histidine kinase
MNSVVAAEPVQAESRERVRFAAVRRRIFAEMSHSGSRWKLVWLLPYHGAVLGLLVARGLEPWRAIVFGCVIAITLLRFALARGRGGANASLTSLLIGTACCFSVLAVTGGMASPMLVSTVQLLVGASFALNEPKMAKTAYFAIFTAGIVGLVLLSHTALGALPVPLAPHDGWPSAEFLTIALTSVGFVAYGSYRFGCTVSKVYEQVALELAERRDELCSENEDRTRALEGIAARLAHEVKNPLAAIKGLSTHMARSSSDAKVAERLAIVAGEADRLQAIVDGFLSFSRGFDDLKVAPTNLHEIAHELALLLETRASDFGVTIEVSGKKDLVVNADGRKVRQALLNVVLNALQASPSGGTVRIDVSRGCPVEGVRIKVTDDGPGMTPEVLERIRKPYFTTKEGGSGLGVAVARGLVEQHGGALTFDSAPGRGTTVTLDLPVCAMKMCKGALPNVFKKTETAPEIPAEAPAR